MALPSTSAATSPSAKSRPLLVPAADVLAKNMRALEFEESLTSPRSTRPPTDTTSPTLLMGLGANTETSTLASRENKTRFRRASSAARANPVIAGIMRMLRPSSNKPKKSDAPKSPDNSPSTLVKISAPLEKAAALISRLPNPLIIFFGLALCVLLVDRFRAHWLNYLAVRAGLTLALLLPVLMAAVWRKTKLFTMVREGQDIFTHPAEHRLDGAEAELKEREERLREAQETLTKNRQTLDALRKELLKEGNIVSQDGIIMPSRKAAEMIAAGALGAGFDAATAAEVEQRRKEENVRRLREEWRARAEQTDDDREQMKKDLRLLADHAATAYTKQTRELKTRSNTSGLAGRAEKLMNLKKMVQAAAIRNSEQERASRHSERSVFGGSVATHSRKRLTLLSRRKRRGTAPDLDGRLTMSESGGRGVSQSDV